jgi:hypothetical protein
MRELPLKRRNRSRFSSRKNSDSPYSWLVSATPAARNGGEVKFEIRIVAAGSRSAAAVAQDSRWATTSSLSSRLSAAERKLNVDMRSGRNSRSDTEWNTTSGW